MLVWILVQAFINIVLGLGLFVMWSKYRRPPKEDPRLSRGLQLLQSKISVLEDLSDRTDVQFKQFNQIMDQRAKQVRKAILDSEQTLNNISQSMRKSLEVADIFEDKIPHEEIIERQNTKKYVTAAKMANEGKSIDEIMQYVDIPRGELEFIAKVNRDELMFDDNMLPGWAVEAPQKVTPDESLKIIGDQFRQACASFDQEQKMYDDQEKAMREKTEQILSSAKNISNKIIDSTEGFIQEAGHQAKTISSDVMAKTETMAKNISQEVLEKTEGLTKELLENSFLKDKSMVEEEPREVGNGPQYIEIVDEPKKDIEIVENKNNSQQILNPKEKIVQRVAFPVINSDEVVVHKTMKAEPLQAPRKVIFPKMDDDSTLG